MPVFVQQYVNQSMRLWRHNEGLNTHAWIVTQTWRRWRYPIEVRLNIFLPTNYSWGGWVDFREVLRVGPISIATPIGSWGNAA